MPFPKLLDFKSRKIIHYSLILCILLIQIAIAAFFYNEFNNRKNITFLENQLSEINALEDLTDHSRKELLNSQDYFQKYLISEDKQDLESFFQSVKNLTKNLDSIRNFKFKNAKLKNNFVLPISNSEDLNNFKILVDSTYEISKSDVKAPTKVPSIKKYNVDFNFDKYEIEKQTYKDTIQKKGLFGRLKDAISGKESIRKDSTVITVNKNSPDATKMKSELDSLINAIDKYYAKEIHKTQINITKTINNKDNKKFDKIFNKLLIYSNDLMNIYEFTIKSAKSDIEKEYKKQNSANNKKRMYLALGSMFLMFIVSILIMYFTRMAFIYEQKLNAANKQIKENLNFKNRILGMLSHELRSPLKIIGIFINRINKKTNDDSIKDYLKSISFTNNTLLMQANQILEYTKNQHVENRLIPVDFNLKAEITSILNSIEPYIETRNNQFIIRENINPNIMVHSDNTKINQIFMNILGNANKFTENGKISVDTTTENIDDKTISLITKISDTGAGISKSDLEKIFEPYYQGVLSEDVENLGAGLGLSLCKEIVELYSGNISVTSEDNQGTTVTFRINLNLK